MLAAHAAPDTRELHTISAGGFSATADAFARDPDSEGLWFLSMVGSQSAVKAIWAALLKQPPDAAHLLAGTDGIALSGGFHGCAIPLRDDRHLDDEDRPPAGLGRLARAGLHAHGGVRLRAGHVPAARPRRG